MSSDKARFEARDVSPVIYGTEKGEDKKTPKKKYVGPERRRDNRRSGHDRRIDVRFEINKEDRRQSHGRREDDKSPDFW